MELFRAIGIALFIIFGLTMFIVSVRAMRGKDFNIPNLEDDEDKNKLIDDVSNKL